MTAHTLPDRQGIATLRAVNDDAKVRAAAPAMLAALQMFVAELRGKAMNDAESAAYRAARAAIQKATA